METLQKTPQGLVIPKKVLKSAGIEDDVRFIIKSKMIILIPKSFTQLTKGLVKPIISVDELHKEYEEYLLERAIGEE